MAKSSSCDPSTVCDPSFFRSLADPNRMAILARLALECRPQSVGDVAGCCTSDYSVVSDVAGQLAARLIVIRPPSGDTAGRGARGSREARP